jgi:hypothetical protein
MAVALAVALAALTSADALKQASPYLALKELDIARALVNLCLVPSSEPVKTPVAGVKPTQSTVATAALVV